MTLEKLERYARDVFYWGIALITSGACWYYSKDGFDGFSLLLAFHVGLTVYHWFKVYGKLGPAERISLEIELEPPSKKDVMDEVQKRR